MSLKADVSALKHDVESKIDFVDEHLHDDLFALEERVKALEDKLEAKAKAVNEEVKAAAVAEANKL